MLFKSENKLIMIRHKSNENFKTTIPNNDYGRPKNNWRMWNVLNIWVAC